MKFLEKKVGRFAIFTLTALLTTSTFIATNVEAAKCCPNHDDDSDHVELYKGKPVKYVFFMVGDGMAATQVNVSRKFNQKPLTIDKLNVKGLTFTSAQNRFITDSGAAATALATGTKTGQTMISVDIQGRPLYTVATKAKKYSKRKVGILSTCSLNHATPAAFYANAKSRGNLYSIGKQLAMSNIDFFGGGGLSVVDGEDGNVYDIAKKNGFTLINTKKAFNNLKKGEFKKVYAMNPRLNSDASMPKMIDETPNDISLAQFTQKAIDLLDNENGFFIFVEGGQIDWACHENDAATAVKEVLAFDAAVKVAYDFAMKHPDETLIVVGGDHETGGLRMGLSGNQFKKYHEILAKQQTSAKVFNKKFDKLASTFKYSEDPNVIDRQFFKVMALVYSSFKINFTHQEEQIIKEGFIATMRKRKGLGTDSGNWGKYNPITVIITHAINQRAGVTWSSFNHTSTPTTVFAYGKGAGIFAGEYQNAALGLKLMSIIGVPAKVEYKK